MTTTTAEALPAGSIKARLKRSLQSRPHLWNRYWAGKQQIKRISMLRYFFYDARLTYKTMFWPVEGAKLKELSSELLFQYHKLEKGLVMPGAPRLFGLDPASRTIELVQRWNQSGYSVSDPIYLGAMETLHAYLAKIRDRDPEEKIAPRVARLLAEFPHRAASLETPQVLPRGPESEELFDAFSYLAHFRRSVRSFAATPVEFDKITAAVELAQLSPSVCNRQPCAVFLVTDPDRRRELLSYQNGNKGFGHLAPAVAIITADQRCFYDASERNEPFVDGGLFSMSFALALSAQGLSSCCLNWCIAPSIDVAVHQKFTIPEEYRIIMLMAIGYAEKDCCVPRSPRRALSEVLFER